MDNHGSKELSRPLSAVRSVKGRAPPLPPVSPTVKSTDGPELSQRLLEASRVTMDQQESLVDQELTLAVVLPGGAENIATVHGSKPMMDLLVTLCAKYHLNPSTHTLELNSANRNHIKFKPNALIGTLEAEKIVIKPKGMEDKNKKMTGPQVPEATVRLIINYKNMQKAILRVNPQVPLEEIMPAVCEKCEFDQKSTVLLQAVHLDEPLDLTKSLNDYGLREVYAKDGKAGGESPEDHPPSRVRQGDKSPPSKDKIMKEKENKGLFSVFRRSKKKSDQTVTSSASASPVLVKQRSGSVNLQSSQPPSSCSNTAPSELPKKRRAPPPPTAPPQSLVSDQEQTLAKKEPPREGAQQVGLTRGFSESSLKRTKRKAPLPPSTVAQDGTPLDRDIKEHSCSSWSTRAQLLETEPTACPCASGPSNDGVPSLSAVVPLELGIPMPPHPLGDEQPAALSSDGKQAENHVSQRESTEGTPQAAVVGVLSADNIKEQITLSEVKPPSLGLDDKSHSTEEASCRTPSPPSLELQPVTQDAEVQASPEAHMDRVGSPTAAAGQSAHLSEAQVPPDVQPRPVSLAEPQKPQPQLGSSSAEPARAERDVATSTEELSIGESNPVAPLQGQMGLADEQPPCYVKHAESKPKPCSELTRDYTPKVGLTTYTIVPQKSQEKRRFFEVELTLEHPSAVATQAAAVVCSERANPPPQTSASQVSGEWPVPHGSFIRDTQQVGSGSLPGSNTNGQRKPSSRPSEIPEQHGDLSEPPSPCDRVAQADAALVGNKKVPPAVKPKPGSLRRSPHKQVPGYYVTSAAEKDRPVSTGSALGEALGPPGREPAQKAAADNGFPPPPPPVDEEEVAGGGPQECRGSQAPTLARQWSAPAGDLSAANLGLASVPPTCAPAASSPFAQAVALAARRSQSYKLGPAFHSRFSVIGQDPVRELSKASKSTDSAILWSAVDVAADPRRGNLTVGGQGSSQPVQVMGMGDLWKTQEMNEGAGPCIDGVSGSLPVHGTLKTKSVNGTSTGTESSQVE